MTEIPESHRDLLDGQFATLATIDDEGLPQLTVVWFLHEDGELRFSLNTARAKTANLRARPECSVLLLDLANAYRYLEIRGRAHVEPDGDYAFADRLGRKYGADLRSTDPPGQQRFAVSLQPVKINIYPAA